MSPFGHVEQHCGDIFRRGAGDALEGVRSESLGKLFPGGMSVEDGRTADSCRVRDVLKGGVRTLDQHRRCRIRNLLVPDHQVQ